MEEIKLIIYTYQDYKNRVPFEGEDKYGILVENGISNKMDVLMKNPYLEDYNQPLLLYVLVDGVLAGFDLSFPTRIRINGVVNNCWGGSSLYVHDNYRNHAIGAQILMYKMKQHPCDYTLSAGISKMALPLQKKMKSKCFEYPLLWQPRNVNFLFQMMKFNKGFSFFFSFISSLFFRPVIGFYNWLSKRNTSDYSINEITDVPDWIQSVVENDEHKYAEYHGKEWFEWSLKNNFQLSDSDNQHLYSVVKDGKPHGFFMTKERTESVPEKNITKVTFGTICEWGIVDGSPLNEYDIVRMSLSTYSKNVDIIEVTTADSVIPLKIKKYFFFNHGTTNFAFRDYTKQCDDAADPTLWRYRRSFSDVVFY